MSDTWIEWRALVRTPASRLATRAEQRRGYVERWTEPHRSMADVNANDYELRRREESYAFVAAWACRMVTAGEWNQGEVLDA